MTVIPFFSLGIIAKELMLFLSNYDSINLAITVLPRLKVSIRIVSGTLFTSSI